MTEFAARDHATDKLLAIFTADDVDHPRQLLRGVAVSTIWRHQAVLRMVIGSPGSRRWQILAMDGRACRLQERAIRGR